MYSIIKKSLQCASLIAVLSACSLTGSGPGDGGTDIVLFEASKDPLSFGLVAATNQNPDQNGRPSPLVVRIYQLADETLFNNAQFYHLLDNDSQILGRDLRKKQQMTIFPGDKNSSKPMVLDRKTRFIGVLAAFRDVDNATPTLIVAINPDDPLPLCLHIEEKSLVFKPTC